MLLVYSLKDLCISSRLVINALFVSESLGWNGSESFLTLELDVNRIGEPLMATLPNTILFVLSAADISGLFLI